MSTYIETSCHSCESIFAIEFKKEDVSVDLPKHCPFCGEVIEDLEELDPATFDEDREEDT
jgi:hypothetical protein